MPGTGRLKPIGTLTDAPTAEEQHGYRVLGIVPCLPPGTSRIFMTKPLT
jgi:hypothetical protein